MTKQDAPTTTDAAQTEFEAWAKTRGFKDIHLRRSVVDGRYGWSGLNDRWEAWQAARASSAAAQPKPDAYLIRCAESGFLRDFADYYDADQFWIHGSARRLIKPQFLFCYEVPLTAPPAKPADAAQQEKHDARTHD